MSRSIDDVNCELAGIAEDMAAKWADFMGLPQVQEAPHRGAAEMKMLGWICGAIPEVCRLTSERAQLQADRLVGANFEEVAAHFGWGESERAHARNAPGLAEYGSEAVILAHSGREMRFPAYPVECTYVRITQGGYELAYWNIDEVKDDPSEVLGAILGAAQAGVSAPASVDLTSLELPSNERQGERA